MIGEKLKEIRESLGLNKKEFAQYIGIKYTTYNGYETEAREPSSDFLILISEKFDVSIDYLLGLKDEREILHAYKLRSGEYEYIKKYRELDDHGKDMVDTVLQKEFDRIVDIQYTEPKAEIVDVNTDDIKSKSSAAGTCIDNGSSNIIDVDLKKATHQFDTIAAHHEGNRYTDAEQEEIRKFKESVKNKRK